MRRAGSRSIASLCFFSSASRTSFCVFAAAIFASCSACFTCCIRFAVSFIWRPKSSKQPLNFEFYKVKQSFAKARLKPLSREDTSSEFEARRFPPVPSPSLGTTTGYFETRCCKSRYLHDLELVSLLDRIDRRPYAYRARADGGCGHLQRLGGGAPSSLHFACGKMERAVFCAGAADICCRYRKGVEAQ